MKFSLINIVESSGLLVGGYWIEDHIGSLSSAIEAARATEAVNSHKITVAVVAELILDDSGPKLLYKSHPPGF